MQLEEIGDVLPILAIRSDGLIRYLEQGQNSFEVSGGFLADPGLVKMRRED